MTNKKFTYRILQDELITKASYRRFHSTVCEPKNKRDWRIKIVIRFLAADFLRITRALLFSILLSSAFPDRPTHYGAQGIFQVAQVGSLLQSDGHLGLFRSMRPGNFLGVFDVAGFCLLQTLGRISDQSIYSAKPSNQGWNRTCINQQPKGKIENVHEKVRWQASSVPNWCHFC